MAVRVGLGGDRKTEMRGSPLRRYLPCSIRLTPSSHVQAREILEGIQYLHSKDLYVPYLLKDDIVFDDDQHAVIGHIAYSLGGLRALDGWGGCKYSHSRVDVRAWAECVVRIFSKQGRVKFSASPSCILRPDLHRLASPRSSRSLFVRTSEDRRRRLA